MSYSKEPLLLAALSAVIYAACCGCCPPQQGVATGNIEDVVEITAHRAEIAASVAALDLMELDQAKLHEVSKDIMRMNDTEIAVPENKGKLQLLIAANYSSGEFVDRLVMLTRHEDKGVQLAAVHGLGVLGEEHRSAARGAIAEWIAKSATSENEKDIGRQAIAALKEN